MDRKSVFQRFCACAPFATMTQVVMRVCIRDEFGAIFEVARGRQYEDTLTFEDFSVAVADVALGVVENPNQAYRKHKQELNVARGRFYDKLNAVSLDLSEQVVRTTAKRLCRLQDALDYQPWEGIDGYRLLAFDGDHLQKSEKRLSVLRESGTAPLPGTAVARIDLGRQIIDRVYLLADAHQQESATCDAIVNDLETGDVVVADRHYCIVDFMQRIAARDGCGFIIRQHGRLPGVLLGQRKKLGRTESGIVYEQRMRLTPADDSLVVRRLTIELDHPTQNGDTEVHVLTNLPKTVDGRLIADQYHRRWEEETAFYYLRMCFNGELTSLDHPQAALFVFSLSVMAYNILQVILSAFYAEYAADEVERLSNLYISQDISQDISRQTPGLLVVFDAADWAAVLPTSVSSQARLLRKIARETDLSEYYKSVRTRKNKSPPSGSGKKRKKKKPNAKHKHLSTAKLLGLAPR